jgi:RimJ/RimL family protein N-acetyltransferase
MTRRHSLSTKRLDLQPAGLQHADLTWPYLADERMWEFFPALRPPTIEALRQRYERWSHQIPYVGAPERWENWICLQRHDGRAVGEVQATYAGSTVYVAYGIFIPFQQRGFAKEAIREVLCHARDMHGARIAKAEMAAANRASVALAESLGFARVATRRDSDPGHGYRGDEFVYQLPLS